MRLSISVEIAHKFGMAGAVAWAALEKVINENSWTQIKVSDLCRLSGKVYSETPIKKALKALEEGGMIYRITDANADGARFKLTPSGSPYFRPRPLQREQSQSQASSTQRLQDATLKV